jgi:hypothetical protein
MASVPTAILLVQFVPQMLSLPSPEALKLEIVERKRAEEALQQAVRVRSVFSRFRNEMAAWSCQLTRGKAL